MQRMKKAVRLYLMYAAVVVLAAGHPLAAMATTTADGTPLVSEESHLTDQSTPQPTSTPAATDTSLSTVPAQQLDTAPVPTVSIPPIVTEAPSSSAPEQQSSTSSESTTSTTAPTINNTLNSNATTGNAAVDSNTTAGNAGTGDAEAVATFINTVNSSVSGGGAEFATFVTDVVGDVHGDIMLYPMLLAAMLQAANTPTESSISATNNASVTNNINLNAASGDAAVTDNTTAGNAATGTANTVANVMNIINSIIAANQSFVGTVNIYGNLDGDILVAPDFLPQLLANNTDSSSASGESLAVTSDDTQSIINNIELTAASGNALVAGNTSAGNASTGEAKTNLVLLNLSGHQIVAKDSLLVFVNVLGQWVGLIVDAPQGASAAALGTGVTTNDVAPDLTINVSNDSQIVNNIKLNSQSGDATVTGNTTAGNASTGNATASANIANVSGSQLGLTGWFGVLFINVFGNWFGSFGVDTARGNALTPGMGGVDEVPLAATPLQPFQFIPRHDSSPSVTQRSSNSKHQATSQEQSVATSEAAPAEEQKENKTVALSAYTPTPGTPVAQSSTPVRAQFDFLPFAASALLLGIGIVAIRTILAYIRERGALA